MTDETSATASEQEGYTPDDELVEGHDYDGIKEYDNPIPPWLSLIFAGTIIWSGFYVVAINLGYISRYQESLDDGLAELQRMKSQAEEKQPKVTQQMLAKAADSDKAVESAEKIFMGNCANCHGKQGQGLVGPNLTDKFWVHGGSLKDIYKTLVNGVTEKGMPAWGNTFDQEQIVNLTAYVRSLQGTDPSGAKKPEGEKFVPGESSESSGDSEG
jgi:cytochrome c oxidase cbb3-type subunit 3